MWIEKLKTSIIFFNRQQKDKAALYAVVRPEVKSNITEELVGDQTDEDFLFLQEVNEVNGVRLVVDFDQDAEDIVIIGG